MFGNLLKAVVGVVIETPVAVVADVITMGGMLNDNKGTHTGAALERVMDNLEKAADPNE